MKAGRVVRILLMIAAALAAGFVVSVGVAWGPFVIYGAKQHEMLQHEIFVLYGEFLDEVFWYDRAILKERPPGQEAAIVAEFGVVRLCWRYQGALGAAVRKAASSGKLGRWRSFESGVAADTSPTSFGPRWTFGDDGTVRHDMQFDQIIGTGWPWVVWTARGSDCVADDSDDPLRRGWLRIGAATPPTAIQGHCRAVPVHLYLPGAILCSGFYGSVLFVAGAAAGRLRARWRRRRGRCPTCGYDLAGNVGGRCPECGRGK